MLFQVKNEFGSPLVDPSSYSVRLLLNGPTVIETACVSAATPPSSPYLGHCAVTALGTGWFTQGAAANVSLVLHSSSGSPVASVALGALTLVPPPSWFTPELRSTAAGSTRVAPVGGVAAGLFVTLPISPLYGGVVAETFWANLYVTTLGYAANSWRIKLFFNGSLLEFHTAQASSSFQTPVVTPAADGVSFSSAGLACGSACSPAELAAATGEAIFLMRVQLAVVAGTPAGERQGEELNLYPYAFEVKNYGGGYIHDKLGGKAYDARGGPEAYGQIVVRVPSAAGILAYLPQPVLFNSAPLTGVGVGYQVQVVAVSGYDLADAGAHVVQSVAGSGALSCSFASLPPGVVGSHTDCTLRLGLSEGEGAAGLSMTAVHTDGSGGSHARELLVSIYAPANLTLLVADGTLDRYTRLDDTLAAPCAGAQPYQRTSIVALLDGFDVTPAVAFLSGRPAC